MKYKILLILVLFIVGCRATPKEYDSTIYHLNVEIQDLSAPEIIISHPLEFEENEKQSIKELIQIKDNKDEQLSFELEGNIDFTKAGDYPLTIKTKDSDLNEAVKSVVVHIKEKKKEETPTITPSNSNHNHQQQIGSPPGTTPTINPNQSSISISPAVSASEVKKGTPKQFLFTDGYNMSSVTKACTSYLSQFNTGGCYPLQDSSGKYIGMEYQP